MDPKYQAFISYSHASDAQLAASLQSSLTRFAKPWYRLRTMRIFRDQTSLSANPALWHSIEQALGEAEYFLLLASPLSAKSTWVQQEVQWWLQHRSVEKLVIVLTDGVILWDNQTADFDWEKTTAIPSSLKGAFPSEPLYADFRAAKVNGKYQNSDPAYRSALLDVAAPLLGRPKDELDGEDIRQHRKAERTAWAAVVFIVVLAIAAAVGLNMAHQRQKIAASRALASAATSHPADRSLALLLSLESRRIADTVEARRSLVAALQSMPHAEAFLWGHTDSVTKAVFSPDGQTVLSTGWDNRIIFWSVATHQLIGQPIAGPKGLVSVAFSPDGSRFATTASGSVVIWNTQTRQPVGAPLKQANENFIHVAFSSSGRLVAASTDPYGGHPGRIFIWDVANQQLIGEPVEGTNLAFSPDDALLAVGRYKDVILYDLRSHREITRPLTGHTKTISVVAFSPDGSLVASGSEDTTVMVWDVKSQEQLGTLEGHTGTVTSLLFGAREADLISGSSDGTVILWSLDDGKAIDTPIKDFGASISSIFAAPDGRLRALALDKDRAILLNVNDDPALGRRIKAPDSGSSNLAFSPDGRFLVSSGEFGDIAEWDVASGQPNGEPLSGHERQVTSLAYSADGKLLMSGSMDGTVIFWDTATHKALGPPSKVHRSPVWSVAFNPGGKTAVSAGDAELIFWDLATRKPIGSPTRSQKDRIWALAFSPDGNLLVSAGNTLVVDLWKDGQQTQPASTLGTAASRDDFEITPVGVSFSPDGALLATSTREHSVTLWNVKTSQPVQPLLYGHTEAVASVAFRRDGKLLATGSADGEIRLWDVDSHELLGTVSAQQDDLKSVVFSPSNGTLASVGKGDSIVFWDMDFESWGSRACRLANRNLTPTEWNTYFGSSPYRKTCPNLE